MTRLGGRHALIPVAGLAALAACPGGTAALAAIPSPEAAAIPRPAAVAATWTILPGGGVMAMPGKATFKDVATGSIFTCQSVSMTGTLKSGSGLSGPGAGSISAVTFTNCTSPLNLRLPLKATALPWHMNLSSESHGTVTGTIGHIRITENGPGCAFVIDGTGATARDGHVTFHYADGTGKLQVLTTGSGLRYFAVQGCAGLFHSGDADTLSVTFTLSPKQAITSP